MARRLLVVVAASALAVGCGGDERNGERAATVKAPPSPGVVGPGRLVGIGGGRQLFVECVGSGTPSVVLEAGLGADAHSWQDVQAQLGRTARTCAYDRAGVGNSVARPGVDDARDDVDDLRRMLGSAGIVHGAAAGSMVVDMSTISPHATRRIAAALAERSVAMVDAPVSGGPAAAEGGTLAIMVGAAEAAFERVQPLLRHLGQSIVHIGDSGSGQIAKACNQLALCVTIEGIAEALALCARLGADPARVRAAMLNGFAASRALEVFGARMVERNFVAGVESRLHHKDLQIVLELAHGLGLAVPGAAATTQTFNALIGAGGGRSDSAALLQIVEGKPIT